MTITLTSTKIAPAMRVSFSMVSSRWAFSGRARLLGGAMLVTGGAMLVTRVVTLALGTLEPSSIEHSQICVMVSAVVGTGCAEGRLQRTPCESSKNYFVFIAL